MAKSTKAKSTSAKGNYYKLRTKKWLIAKGFEVALLERLMWIPPKQPGGRMVPIKRDQFGSDLLAVSGTEVVFVQVKLNRKNIAAGRHEFNKFTFPVCTQQWIVVWEPKAREPEVIEIERG